MQHAPETESRNRLLAARMALLGHTNRTLSAAVGVSPNTINALRNAPDRRHAALLVRAVAAALNCTPAEIGFPLKGGAL